MKILEVIKKLQEVQKEHGNVEVVKFNYGEWDLLEDDEFIFDKAHNQLRLGRIWIKRK